MHAIPPCPCPCPATVLPWSALPTPEAVRGYWRWRIHGRGPRLHHSMLFRRRQVVVRCEEINISGGLVRQKAKYERFLKKRMLTAPTKGPIHYRAPSRILWRTMRGCAVLCLAAGRDALSVGSAWD